MDNTEVATFIENGIEYLKEKEWVQGKIYHYATPPTEVVGVCALGSLILGNSPHLIIEPCIVKVRKELSRDLKGNDIVDFNDLVAKNKGDVIDQMMITAKRLRNS